MHRHVHMRGGNICSVSYITVSALKNILNVLTKRIMSVQIIGTCQVSYRCG